MQAAEITEQGHGSAETLRAFHNSMLELGLLGVMVLVFVAAIYLLRRGPHRHRLLEE